MMLGLRPAFCWASAAGASAASASTLRTVTRNGEASAARRMASSPGNAAGDGKGNGVSISPGHGGVMEKTAHKIRCIARTHSQLLQPIDMLAVLGQNAS